jgi:hypothetical protein
MNASEQRGLGLLPDLFLPDGTLCRGLYAIRCHEFIGDPGVFVAHALHLWDVDPECKRLNREARRASDPVYYSYVQVP